MAQIHKQKGHFGAKHRHGSQGPVPPSRTRGFSLLEIILVISIMTVLAAVVVPRYASASTRYRADLCVQRMAADVRRVQALARSAGSSRSIDYDVSANEYTMTDVESLDGGASSSAVYLGDAPYHATLVSAVFGADDTLQFNGWGSPASGGTVVITVGSEERSLSVDGSTGEVTVE